MIITYMLFFQAETEELAKRVELLTAENTSLKREINRLTESCKKLSSENSALMVLPYLDDVITDLSNALPVATLPSVVQCTSFS
jgi:molecular chaperone GrpE (heat shock protein)